jgi:hypothetical protein
MQRHFRLTKIPKQLEQLLSTYPKFFKTVIKRDFFEFAVQIECYHNYFLT